ncbi:MAG: hypothetical protein WD449_02315 [Candidatus Babeliales bacterium]
MKIKLLILISTVSSLQSLHFVSAVSESPKGKPSVNFSGTITTNDGATLQGENILIAGNYEDINLYKKPKKHSSDPKDFAIYPDLADLKTINVSPKLYEYQPPTTPASKKTPPVEKYHELLLTYANGTEHKALIPVKKKVSADERVGNKLVEQKIDFNAVSSITISSAHAPSEKMSKKNNSASTQSTPIPNNDSSHALATDAEHTMQFNVAQATFIRIGQLLNQLTSVGKQQYDDLKDTIVALVKDLKDSIDRAFS